MKKVIMAEYHEFDIGLKLGDHQYAEQFLYNGYKVLWLSPLYNHMLYFKDKDLYFKRKRNNKSSFYESKKNLYCYSPFSIFLFGKYPILNNKKFAYLSIQYTFPRLEKILKNNSFYDVDILWLTNPKYYYLTKIVNYKKLFYRCADEISEFKSSFNNLIELENKIIKEADKVFVTSYNLMKKKSHLRKDFIYLPNGVEVNNFIRDTYNLPEEYNNLKNKKVVYVGAIDSWFDVNLIEYCAKKLTDFNFYLIGSAKINLSKLEYLKNIYVLGKRKYEDVPNYLNYGDVAIIPFKINSLTDSVSPIKLYEYMSVGLNVVSTNFKEMNYINSPAYVAKNYDEFCDYIVQGIKNKKQNREKNIQFAKENTWKKKFKEIKNLL